jgi:hypothetical protein
MKTFAAIAITAATLAELGTGVAHAHPNDVFDIEKYVAEVKQHGWVEGRDYQDENQLIVSGLIDCNGIKQHGGSRDAWLNMFKNTTLLPPSEVAVTTDAAIDVFCPQYKGSR